MITQEKASGIQALVDVLRFSEDFGQVLDGFPFGMLLIDEDDKIIYKNDTSRSKFGVDFFSACLNVNPNIIHEANKAKILHEQAENPDSFEPDEYELYSSERRMWFLYSVYRADMKTETGKKIYLHTIQDITNKKVTEKRLEGTITRLMKIIEAGIEVTEKIVESRDPYTAYHQKNVGTIVYHMAIEMGFSEDRAQLVMTAGLLHDIGKISIPVEILNRPGKLNKYEYATIRSHVQTGHDILQRIDFELPIADMILQHHERLDGTGYPNKLKGDEICIEARMISVADVLDAMTAHRPYRPSYSVSDTIKELQKHSGTVYDEDAVKAVVKLIKSGVIDPVELHNNHQS